MIKWSVFHRRATIVSTNIIICNTQHAMLHLMLRCACFTFFFPLFFLFDDDKFTLLRLRLAKENWNFIANRKLNSWLWDINHRINENKSVLDLFNYFSCMEFWCFWMFESTESNHQPCIAFVPVNKPATDASSISNLHSSSVGAVERWKISASSSAMFLLAECLDTTKTYHINYDPPLINSARVLNNGSAALFTTTHAYCASGISAKEIM